MINRLKAKIKDLNPAGKFQKSSYSQCGEDLIVKFIFDSLGIKNPGYIDIGAHHPFYINNTAIFYNSGSVGINIEPDPVLFREFTIHRKKDININAGIGTENSVLDFYLMSSPTLNSFSKEAALDAEKKGYSIIDVKQVQLYQLDKIIREDAAGKFPDFLSLDVEGLDMDILASIDYERNAPTVICVETIAFSTTGEAEKDRRIIDFLETRGYTLYADTYINSIFVKRNEWVNRK